VEITAKVFHGYNAGKAYEGIDEVELKRQKDVTMPMTMDLRKSRVSG
jgi:hypothetical protein